MRNLVLTQIDGISPRAVHCCSDVGIMTIGDLFEYMKCRSLTTIKNCGLKTAKELARIMSQYEKQVMGFKYDLFAVCYDEAAEPAAAYTPAVEAIEDAQPDTVKALAQIYADTLEAMPDKDANLIRGEFGDVRRLLSPVIGDAENVFALRDGWAVEDHFHFWQFCILLLQAMTERVAADSCPRLHGMLSDRLAYIRSKQRARKLSFVHHRLSALLSPPQSPPAP